MQSPGQPLVVSTHPDMTANDIAAQALARSGVMSAESATELTGGKPIRSPSTLSGHTRSSSRGSRGSLDMREWELAAHENYDSAKELDDEDSSPDAVDVADEYDYLPSAEYVPDVYSLNLVQAQEETSEEDDSDWVEGVSNSITWVGASQQFVMPVLPPRMFRVVKKHKGWDEWIEQRVEKIKGLNADSARSGNAQQEDIIFVPFDLKRVQDERVSGRLGMNSAPEVADPTDPEAFEKFTRSKRSSIDGSAGERSMHGSGGSRVPPPLQTLTYRFQLSNPFMPEAKQTETLGGTIPSFTIDSVFWHDPDSMDPQLQPDPNSLMRFAVDPDPTSQTTTAALYEHLKVAGGKAPARDPDAMSEKSTSSQGQRARGRFDYRTLQELKLGQTVYIPFRVIENRQSEMSHTWLNQVAKVYGAHASHTVGKWTGRAVAIAGVTAADAAHRGTKLATKYGKIAGQHAMEGAQKLGEKLEPHVEAMVANIRSKAERKITEANKYWEDHGKYSFWYSFCLSFHHFVGC